MNLPIYISPSALARLGHPDGEMNLTRAAGSAGILQGVQIPTFLSRGMSDVEEQISNNASCSVEEIMSVKRPEQNIVFQVRIGSVFCRRC
jgi:L-lactate dehydrogenase (cytochrome)